MPSIWKTLGTNEWNQVNDRATAFEKALQGTASVELEQFLPAEGEALRPKVLFELVKTELSFRWGHGRGVLLDHYLTKYPELGPARSLPADLVYEEYWVRHRHGDRPPLASYQTRFPEQFAELERLVQARPVSSLPAAAAPAGPAAAGPRLAAVGSHLEFGGGYTLIARLGAGAFGEVWRARSDGGGFEVAIKIIFHALDHEDVQRELQSLEVIRGLRHHFLLMTQSFWFFSDRLYIVMELADHSLRQQQAACQRARVAAFPAAELLSYTRETAEALDYLHSKGVMHRDIKPENILLLEGHVKVADFGLAKLQDNLRSMNASTSGTPLYMPPEVWQSKLSLHSDQYSLALTYAELRLGRRPFVGKNMMELMRDHLERAPDLGHVPEAEQQVLRQALDKDPNRRFPSCKEFARALEQSFGVAPPTQVEPAPPAAPAAVAECRDDAGEGQGTIAPHRTDPGLAATQPPRPGAAVVQSPGPARSRPHGYLLGGLVGVLLLLPAGYALWHFLGPAFESAGAVAGAVLERPTAVRVRAGGTIPVYLGLDQVASAGPIRLSCTGLPGDVKLEPADPIIPDHARGVEVRLTADDHAKPRTVRLAIAAPGSDTVLDVTILPLATLPPGCTPTEEAAVHTARNGLKYYTWIRYHLPDSTPVLFRLIPELKDTDPPTFYIMRDKVSNGLFSKFARPAEQRAAALAGATAVGCLAAPLGTGPLQATALVKARAADESQWRLGGTKEVPLPDGTVEVRDVGTADLELPVLRVTALEAHQFAHWLGGRLPTASEWDRAAGRWEKGRDGPFQGTWQKLKADPKALARIGIGRKRLGPMALDEDTLDISPFDCRHMSGNGYEWTDTLAQPPGMTVAQAAVQAFPLDSRVMERGRNYTAGTPLLFAKMEAAAAAHDPLEPSPFIGFRVVLHP